ncbi:glucan endo-1 3-beta-glucosidas [Striga asiatica]|uniref:glucan endo-1,3-beta-D-glucosidase n=1 Tax=Striga asiatica TaxID=4170 RepID=A0A5A7NWA8_STRAF|nr:glucan endo-1 3-beta-glucosidas [Striga asiatica]
MGKPHTNLPILHILLLHSLLTLLGFALLPRRADSLGINYGQVADNLPTPDRVVELLRSLRLTKARIYDTNPQILSAFANSGIELIVTIENSLLPSLSDPGRALSWARAQIAPFLPATRITGIAVGNEILTGDPSATDPDLIAHLVPAMSSIHSALVRLGLATIVRVSTPCSLSVLQESFPPSAGSFRPDIGPVVAQLLQFLASTGSPFWINAYPYFAYKDSPARISLDYALFNPNEGTEDPGTGLKYDNMLYAQVDAVVFAMARFGFGGLEVRVSETGWPSRGDSDEVGATLENAAVYNRNIMRRQMRGEGTPLRPRSRLEIYVFALFNEDLKPGPTSERNYGLFQPDGTMAYNVGLSALSTDPPPGSSGSAASISLTSGANNKVKQSGYSSLVCAIFLNLLALQI